MDHRFTTSHPLTVDLQVPAGMIAVQVHDAPVATVHVDGARADGVEVTFDERPSGDRLSVAYRGKKWFTLFSSGRDLEVAVVVPAGTTLDVSTGAADVEVSGTVAAISYRTGSGDLRFDDVTGNVTAKTASGDVTGEEIAGSLRFHGASGDLSVGRVGATSAGRSASGDLSIGRIEGDTSLATASGDVSVTVVADGKTTIRTVSGDVEVGIIEGADVYLDLSSTSGDVTCELEPSSGPTTGDDLQLVLDATSVSGDVRVRKVTGMRGR
jgi:DUF4097 and DUF4098 domain-containing protein YvlB